MIFHARNNLLTQTSMRRCSFDVDFHKGCEAKRYCEGNSQQQIRRCVYVLFLFIRKLTIRTMAVHIDDSENRYVLYL